MRRKLAFSLVAELVLLGMLGMTAIAENDQTLGNGALRAHLLGTLNTVDMSNPKNVNMDSAAGSIIFVPLAGKIAIHLHKGDDFAVWNAHGTAGRAESQLPDAGTDPFINDDPRGADTETAYSV